MNKQIDAFADFPAKTLVRRSDPDTSKQAAAEIEDKLTGARLYALEFVKKFPGMTASELAYCSQDRDGRRIGRRLNEIEKLGWVMRGEPRKCSQTGRNAYTWWPK